MKQISKRFSFCIVVLLACSLTLINLTGCFIKDMLVPSSGNVTTNGNVNENEIDAQFEQITEVNNSISELKKKEDYLKGSKDEQTDAVLKEIQNQAKAGKIKSDSINCDRKEHIITFEYSNGVLGCDFGSGFDDEFDNVDISSEFISKDQLYPSLKEGKTADASILNGMTDRTAVNAVCVDLATEWSATGVNTKIDDTVTLDDLTNLKGFEFVYVKMHGRYCVFGKDNEYTPTIALEQHATKEIDKKYSNDLKVEKCIGKTTDNDYFITPDFFKAHYKSGDLSGSIWVFGCCEMMGAHDSEVSTKLENVFKGLSVSAFVAFYNSNHTNYNLDFVASYMKSLIAGKTVKEAFEKAANECGKTDNAWYKKKYGKASDMKEDSYPILKGDERAVLVWENGTNEQTTLAPLTDDQALTAIRNYLYEELGYDQYNGEAPWYLDLDGKSDSSTAVVHLRAYTGSHNFFYIDRISGETHEKAYPPHLTVDVDEPIDGATFNARDYLNRTPAPTESSTETTVESESTGTTETTANTSSQSSEPQSTKQLAYAAYLRVLEKNKTAIKAYKNMNVFNTMKKSEGWIGNRYWFGDKPILQKSANKNCALCELTGDSVPELLFITSNKKKLKLHVYTYDSSKGNAVEVFSLSLSNANDNWYMGYSLFRTKDGKLAFFYDYGLGNGDSGYNANVFKYSGGKLKKEKSFELCGTSPTVSFINDKKYSFKKFESEYKKMVNTTEQIIFYTVILDNGSNLKAHSKTLKSVAMTYDSCVKTLKGI